MQRKSKQWQACIIVLLSLNSACGMALAEQKSRPPQVVPITPNPPPLISAETQHCDKALQRALDEASVILRNNSQICEAEHTHWLGRTVNHTKKWLPELLGYPAQDCRLQNQREYSTATGLAKLLHHTCLYQAPSDKK